MVRGSLDFFADFFEQYSLRVFAYIGTSFIACNKGILTNKFCSSPNKSNLA
jgi:hypothetical protein